MRTRLEALLAAHEAPKGVLGDEAAAGFGVPPSGGMANSPAKAGTPNAPTIDMPQPIADEAVGMTLGRYKLREKLGEGGCGSVYVAEQTEPVRRKVALKVIKLGMDTREVIARFEVERQALAMMDHPNIAKVLDAETGGEGDRKADFSVGDQNSAILLAGLFLRRLDPSPRQDQRRKKTFFRCPFLPPESAWIDDTGLSG